MGFLWICASLIEKDNAKPDLTGQDSGVPHTPHNLPYSSHSHATVFSLSNHSDFSARLCQKENLLDIGQGNFH